MGQVTMAKSRMYTRRCQQVRSCSTCYCFVIVNFDSLANASLFLTLQSHFYLLVVWTLDGWDAVPSYPTEKSLFQKTWEQLGRRRSPKQRHSDTLGPSGAKVIAPSQGLVYCASQKIPKKFNAQKKKNVDFEQTQRKKRNSQEFFIIVSKDAPCSFSSFFFDLKKHRALDSQQVHKTQDGWLA